MWIGLWVVIAVVAAYGLLWLGRIPIRHKPLDPRKIRKLLYTLLANGGDCSVLIIRVRKDKRFIQFRMSFPQGGLPRIEFGFPRAPWSENIYERVAEFLTARGAPVERMPTATPGQVSEFLLIDFQEDIYAAQEVATALLSEVFGVVPERDCYAILQGDLSSRAPAQIRAYREGKQGALHKGSVRRSDSMDAVGEEHYQD